MKQMYLDADKSGSTYLHISAIRNTRLAFTMFVRSVKEGDANIQELRRIDANGCDPISLAAMHGHFDLVDFILNKLFAEFPNEAREICKAPIARNGKTLSELVIAEMLSENYVLEKFSMLGDELPKISARLEKLERSIFLKLSRLEEQKPSQTAAVMQTDLMNSVKPVQVANPFSMSAIIAPNEAANLLVSGALDVAKRALQSCARSNEKNSGLL